MVSMNCVLLPCRLWWLVADILEAEEGAKIPQAVFGKSQPWWRVRARWRFHDAFVGDCRGSSEGPSCDCQPEGPWTWWISGGEMVMGSCHHHDSSICQWVPKHLPITFALLQVWLMAATIDGKNKARNLSDHCQWSNIACQCYREFAHQQSYASWLCAMFLCWGNVDKHEHD